MTFIEPTLPSIPVNVSGAAPASAECVSLQQLRNRSCYRRARTVVKAAFAFECVSLAAGWSAIAGVRHGPVLLLWTLAMLATIAVSFAALEVAGAIFDLADAQIALRSRKEDGGHG